VRAEIRGLTLWRPWSGAISWCGKRCENRSWRPKWIGQQQSPTEPGVFRVVDPFYLAIHGGKKQEPVRVVEECLRLGLAAGYEAPRFRMHETGIVAVARLVGFLHAEAFPGSCFEDDPQVGPWFCGPWGWLLDGVKPLPKPVECKGAQGLWRLPDDVLERVRFEWRNAA